MTARAFAVLVASVAFLTAACGGGDGRQASSATTVASPAPTAAPTPAPCPTVPTTQPESMRLRQVSNGTVATLADVTVTTQPCLDRMTFTFSGDTLPGYDVRYTQAWSECGSGKPVSTQGRGQLAVTFLPAYAHNDAGQPTVATRSFLPSYPAIKEARLTCDFEAEVSWVLGSEVRYFTVTTSPSPAQVTVDVYH
jgi:hypothetical protein